MKPVKAIKEEAFQIMLTLIEGESHGYAIMQRISERTQGRMQPLPGALYRHLHRMLEAGWVEERQAGTESPRRRRYAITAQGRQVMAHETRRLSRMVEDASRLGLVDGRSTP